MMGVSFLSRPWSMLVYVLGVQGFFGGVFGVITVPLRRLWSLRRSAYVNEFAFFIGGGRGEGMMFGFASLSAMGLHQFSISLWIPAWIISCTSFAEYEALSTVMQLFCSLSYSVKYETKSFYILSTVFLAPLGAVLDEESCVV